MAIRSVTGRTASDVYGDYLTVVRITLTDQVDIDDSAESSSRRRRTGLGGHRDDPRSYEELAEEVKQRRAVAERED